MPYLDPEVARVNARERTARYRARHRDRLSAERKALYPSIREAEAARKKLARDRDWEAHRVREKAAQNRRADKARAEAARYRKANLARFAAYAAKYREQNPRVIPAWADLDAIKAIYQCARDVSDLTGEPYEVDHIVPLRGKNVCGLHVENNLRVITKAENRAKRNRLEEAE